MTHLKSLLFATSVLSSFFLLSSYTSVGAKTLWLEEDDFRSSTIAQGDAEEVPAEFLLTDEEMQIQTQDIQNTAANAASGAATNEKIPTITAEGGFLLPTYVLPEANQGPTASTVAAVDANNPWRGEEQAAVPSPARSVNPVKIAGMAQPAETNQQLNMDTQLLQNIEQQYRDTTQLLADTAKRLAALENGVNDLKEKNTQLTQTAPASAPAAVREPVRRQPLLLPLAPVQAEKTEAKPAAVTPVRVQPDKVFYIDYVLSVLDRVNNQPVTYSESDDMVLRSIPQELKLNFLPNSADISTQSFKWIKAFSYHPKKSMADIVEVRMSSQDLELQSRRFALIKGALLSNGLSPRQIRFVLTDRDPDSIVLRNVKVQPEQEVFYERQKNGTYTPQIIQKW